jgi:hypothetical protein
LDVLLDLAVIVAFISAIRFWPDDGAVGNVVWLLPAAL